MEKSTLKMMGVISIILIFIAIIYVKFFYVGYDEDLTNAIIGGADGPTAIFVATSTASSIGIYVGTAFAIVIAIICWNIYRKKRSK